MLKSDEKIKILELRNKGYGYKSIAGILKVKRDDVRDYCKSKGVTGYLGYGKLVVQEPKIVKIDYADSCKFCSKEINVTNSLGRKHKFCSDKCRRAWWNEHPECKDKSESAWYSFICLYCGKDFKAYGNRYRKYCSRRCCTEHRFGSAT